MEEGGGESVSEVQRRLEVWREFEEPDVVDLYDFHKTIAPQYFGKRVTLQKTWARIARFVLAAKGEFIDDSAIRAYQAEHLGRRGGETCLLELLPLPSPGIKDWNYGNWFPMTEELQSRGVYTNTLSLPRTTLLKERIQKWQPRIVVFYGLGYLRRWQKIAGTTLTKDETGIRFARDDNTFYLALKHPAAWGQIDRIYEAAGQLIRESLRE